MPNQGRNNRSGTRRTKLERAARTDTPSRPRTGARRRDHRPRPRKGAQGAGRGQPNTRARRQGREHLQPPNCKKKISLLWRNPFWEHFNYLEYRLIISIFTKLRAVSCGLFLTLKFSIDSSTYFFASSSVNPMLTVKDSIQEFSSSLIFAVIIVLIFILF